MTGVRVYDPARGSRVYLHTDPITGRLVPAPTTSTSAPKGTVR
jgi:hypothetical protein